MSAIDPLDRALRVHESDTPRDALRALSGTPPVRAAARIGPDGEPSEAWPEHAFAALPRESLRPPEAPEARTGPDGAELLLLPLADAAGALALLLDAGSFAAAPAAWGRVGDAWAHLLRRSRRLQEMESETGALRQRAEESEALHVLGLAANRSLDPDEVLDLVSRFTRTLLGAHYVTVNTREGEEVRAVAAVGLRSPAELPHDDPFAAQVIHRGKPLTIGQADSGDAVECFPFHAGEGMHVGLGVPLSLYGSTFGALVIGYRRPYTLVPRDTRLALTLAGHAAVAINNAQLHRNLAERSRELERAYQELRWSAQAKERFFASMSHELRTPLNAILGYQSLLLDGIAGTLSEPQRVFVENAHRASQSLLLLVNDVLDLSKIEAGKMELFLRPVGLDEIIRDAVSTISPLVTGQGIQLDVPPLDGLPVLHTDADRVRQILLNLLSNAVKFTERGSVALTVEREPRGEPVVEVCVSDTGPGIAPEDLERIFHEFEQVVGASARGGTGLGLPISRKLARLLGGELRVESQPGTGSTFVLRLPLQWTPEPGTGVAGDGE